MNRQHQSRRPPVKSALRARRLPGVGLEELREVIGRHSVEILVAHDEVLVLGVDGHTARL